MNHIDDYNYYGDGRVRASNRKAWYESLDDNRMIATVDIDGEVRKAPFTYGVCPLCDGKGSHVNPSIDSGGLTADDFYEDPEFKENYMNGTYDIPCNECHGKRVVPVCDDPEVLKERELNALYELEREVEIRMGY